MGRVRGGRRTGESESSANSYLTPSLARGLQECESADPLVAHAYRRFLCEGGARGA